MIFQIWINNSVNNQLYIKRNSKDWRIYFTSKKVRLIFSVSKWMLWKEMNQNLMLTFKTRFLHFTHTWLPHRVKKSHKINLWFSKANVILKSIPQQKVMNRTKSFRYLSLVTKMTPKTIFKELLRSFWWISKMRWIWCFLKRFDSCKVKI